jgi:tetratricopeptide (TPR) repeat protein
MPRLLSIFIVITALACTQTHAQDEAARTIAECDRLSASELDLDRPASVSGVPLLTLDASAAVPACEAAVKVAPDNRRLLFQLGRAYGVAKNYLEARVQYERAVALGSVVAANNLATLFDRGLGGPKNPPEARRLFEKAAAGGLYLAMYNLGFMYEEGRGVPQDLAQARRWYEKAAAAGSVPAMTKLGTFYEKGLAVETDYEEARRWFEKAAALGDAEAINSLRALSQSQNLPIEPVLRIETGQHGAHIFGIDTDAANRFAVTASPDKTVRVWSLPEGRPLRILRLPLDFGDIGKAYAAAISPDGSTVAVGGYIGVPSHGFSIFLFDRASGELTKRLGNLPNVVNHLAYSPDGQRLAASLLGGNGIRVFDAGHGYQPLPSDTQYTDGSDWAMFDHAGRLVTTSSDGFIRLYAADQYADPVTRFRLEGHVPQSVAFSPDGSRVAVSFADTPKVVVLSGKELTQLFEANTAGIDVKGCLVSVGSVAWSQDGRFLFAGACWWVNDVVQVRRWSKGGRGAFVDIPAAPEPIVEILALKSGAMLFAHLHGFGLISPDTKVKQLHGLGGLDVGSGDGPVVSPDGGAVQIDGLDVLVNARHTYRFNLLQRRVDIDPPTDAALLAPITQVPGLAVANWEDSMTPAVNGTPIKLYPGESARSLAIVPGTQHFVIGAQWSVRLFDQTGYEFWPKPLSIPGIAWGVNVTSDGRLVVVLYDDGTIHWLRLSDGKELLALFIHPDGQRWVAWTPQGYYDASVGGDELVGWHINHGFDHVPDFYPVSQFRARFYRPDVIRRVLQTPNLDIEEAVQNADQEAGRPMPKGAPVSSLLTPVVEINDPKDAAAVDRTDIQLGYSVRLPSPDDTLGVEARIDGAKVPAEDRRLVDTGSARAGILHLTIPRRDSKVSVIAYNANGASEPASIHVQWRGPGTDPKLTLYVLAIGISNYKDTNLRLHFAAKDADDFVALAKTQEGGLYEKVITHPPKGSLRDDEATREAVLDELDWIMRAVTNTNDVAMVFLSGHGVTTPDQHYRFLPYDYESGRVERTTISDSELRDYLTKIGGKKVFFFDTCYSGAVLPGKTTSTQANVDKFANDLKAAENGIVVFTSSTGNELSLERDEWNNGAFAKAVVEGLRGAAAQHGYPVVMISDLEGYVSRRVKELTAGNQRPMVAKPGTVEDFPIAKTLP